MNERHNGVINHPLQKKMNSIFFLFKFKFNKLIDFCRFLRWNVYKIFYSDDNILTNLLMGYWKKNYVFFSL